MKVSEADRGVRAEAASAKKFVYGFLEDPGIDDVRSLLGGYRSHGHVFGRIASISLGMVPLNPTARTLAPSLKEGRGCKGPGQAAEKTKDEYGRQIVEVADENAPGDSHLVICSSEVARAADSDAGARLAFP